MPLSRIYRPQRFQDVTGQQHVTETLRREVSGGMIAHAYVFSGPRGVGKTTTARIFAKALLCERPVDGEPCNACAACQDVTDGRCIDLIEMDAASHTGVDNVREAIVEHVRFAPARWKRKIYVIDEAHMLSTSAWNALLKTLEEPPSYAVFMLATTELHKVPATIQSRCQRFAFRRIAPKDLAERIRFLAKQESIVVDEPVVSAITGAADGYVRDAESLLEQLASLGETHITADLAALMLPPSRLPEAAELLRLVAKRQTGPVLCALRALLDEGAPPLPLFDDLLAVIRLLIRSEDPAEAAILAEGDEGQRAVSKLRSVFTPSELGEAALILIERRRDAKSGVDPVFALELALVMMTSAENQNDPTAPPSHPSTPTVEPPPATPRTSSGSSRHETVADPAQKTTVQEKQIVVSEAKIEVTTAPRATGELVVHDVHLHWREVIRFVEEENRSLPFILKIAKPEAVRGNVVVIRFSYPFHQEKIIEELKNKRIVENALRKALQRDDLRIEGVVGETIGQADRATTVDIVSKVLNVFGGSVVE